MLRALLLLTLLAGPVPQDVAAERPGGWRLADEASPYLRQHADNAVDWYPWGDEAFDRARREDKPVFLSIGYSACHWCHVMEHESFEDEETAAFLREHFVSVKVDREQRPDVDARYMEAVQEMTGAGGWPLTAFLTPEGAPFAGGTYYPKEATRGMPAFLDVLGWIADGWEDDRAAILETARGNHRRMQRDLFPEPAAWDGPTLLRDAARTLHASLDPTWGGVASPRPQRFPPSMLLRFLFRQRLRTEGTDDPVDLERAWVTLDMMASGGLRDHVGGGFHRYSVDPQWRIPHFEKMLYDNAVLAATYAEAHALTGRAWYGSVARDTLAWLQRDMRSPEGLYYAARDADSLPFDADGAPLPGAHPEEGEVYTWTRDELRAALGEADAERFAELFDVRGGAGNFERGRSQPMPLVPLDRLAETGGGEAFRAWVASCLERLRAARDRRPQAFRDEKCLTAWNGLALSGFATAARLLDDDALRAETASLAAAIRAHLLSEDADGRLVLAHQRFEGVSSGTADLTDHADLARSVLDAYHATGDPALLALALRLANRILDLFEDDHRGGLFATTGEDPLLPGRSRALWDGARAAGQSVALHHLARTAPLDDSGRLGAAVDRALDALAPLAAEAPRGLGSLLTAIDARVGPLAELVVDGEPGLDATRALAETARGAFLPAALVVTDARAAAVVLAAHARRGDGPREDSGRPDDADAPAVPSLLDGRRAPPGEARAWVCRGGVCLAPVSTPDALLEQLPAVARRDPER